jgi:probable rRNA maturation factor
MKVQIENKQKIIKLNRRKIRSTVTKLLRQLDCPDKELSLLFVNDKTIQLLNKQYLGKDRPTNVLSFSLQEGKYNYINPHLLGDIVISVDTALKDATAAGLSLEEEIDVLITHGLLHLLGYNHENTTAEETRKMRVKERKLLRTLNYHDLI